MGVPRIERFEQNAIINGSMSFWQRVAAATTTVNTATPVPQTYAADRHGYLTAGSTVKNFSIVRSSDLPTMAQMGENLANSYMFSCLTAITSPAATDLVLPLRHRLEGFDYQRFPGNVATLGFWIKVTSTASFPISVPVAIGNTSRSYVTTVPVAANNIWQFCTVQVTFEGVSGYSFDNSMGIQITIGAGAVGSNFVAGSANTWLAGDFYGVSGAFNSMGVNTNVVRVAAMSLVLGVADAAGGNFVRAGRSRMVEFQMCQRFYEKSYDFDSAPGTVTTNGAFADFTEDAGTVINRGVIFYKTNKRSGSNTIVFWNPTTGISGTWTNCTPSVQQQGEHNFAASYSLAGNTATSGHWAVEAEL